MYLCVLLWLQEQPKNKRLRSFKKYFYALHLCIIKCGFNLWCSSQNMSSRQGIAYHHRYVNAQMSWLQHEERIKQSKFFMFFSLSFSYRPTMTLKILVSKFFQRKLSCCIFLIYWHLFLVCPSFLHHTI